MRLSTAAVILVIRVAWAKQQTVVIVEDHPVVGCVGKVMGSVRYRVGDLVYRCRNQHAYQASTAVAGAFGGPGAARP